MQTLFQGYAHPHSCLHHSSHSFLTQVYSHCTAFPQNSTCRFSLVSGPKPARFATGWGKGGVSCGAAALPCGWQIPTGFHSLLTLTVGKQDKGTESRDKTLDNDLQVSFQSFPVTSKPHEKLQFCAALT